MSLHQLHLIHIDTHIHPSTHTHTYTYTHIYIYIIFSKLKKFPKGFYYNETIAYSNK